MPSDSRLPAGLLVLRLSIFLVMLMWTIDKFLNPQHAIGVYEHFYFIAGVAPALMTAIAVLELLLLLAFVAGLARTWTYGAVLALHAVSTVSSFRQYLDPFEGPHLLFFTAWPMLAACWVLFSLRDEDCLLCFAPVPKDAS